MLAQWLMLVLMALPAQPQGGASLRGQVTDARVAPWFQVQRSRPSEPRKAPNAWSAPPRRISRAGICSTASPGGAYAVTASAQNLITRQPMRICTHDGGSATPRPSSTPVQEATIAESSVDSQESRADRAAGHRCGGAGRSGRRVRGRPKLGRLRSSTPSRLAWARHSPRPRERRPPPPTRSRSGGVGRPARARPPRRRSRAPRRRRAAPGRKRVSEHAAFVVTEGRDDDAEWAAQVMAASEPWTTLGRGLEQCLAPPARVQRWGALGRPFGRPALRFRPRQPARRGRVP